MADYIPLDVIINHIFVRLPARSLTNCMCVCKQWLKILTGSEFARIHIKQLTNDNHHHLKFICGPLMYRYVFDRPSNEEHAKTERACSGIFYSFDLGSPSPKLTRLPGFQLHRMNNYRRVQTLGYVNGLMCMEVRFSGDLQRARILFGNPLTGYYKILPDPLVGNHLIVGFGYDSHTDDYKFVRVDSVTRHPHVFSLKSNSWSTNLESSDEHKIGSHEFNISVGTFVKGVIYWVNRGEEATIVGFNLKDNKFLEMPVPRQIILGNKTLRMLHGSLCLVNKFRRYNKVFGIEMWWYNEENKLWIELMKLNEVSPSEYIHLLAITKDGRVLCWVEQRFEREYSHPKNRYALIDPRTSSIQGFDISGIDNGFLQNFTFRSQFSGYIDTLVSPS